MISPGSIKTLDLFPLENVSAQLPSMGWFESQAGRGPCSAPGTHIHTSKYPRKTEIIFPGGFLWRNAPKVSSSALLAWIWPYAHLWIILEAGKIPHANWLRPGSLSKGLWFHFTQLAPPVVLGMDPLPFTGWGKVKREERHLNKSSWYCQEVGIFRMLDR